MNKHCQQQRPDNGRAEDHELNQFGFIKQQQVRDTAEQQISCLRQAVQP